MPQKAPTLPEADGDSRIDRNWDDEFNNAIANNYDPQTVRDLENEYDSGLNANKEAADGNSGNASGELGERESTPGGDAGWKNNFGNSAGGSKQGGALNNIGGMGGPMPLKALKLAKKGGPFGIIVAAFLAIAGIISFFGGPGLLLVNVTEVLTEKLNFQLGSTDARNTKILKAKFDNTTTGACGKVTWRCRFTTFSDKEIEAFKKAGIEVEKDGKAISGRNKIKTMTIDGEKLTAKQLSAKLADPKQLKVQGALSKAYNMKYISMSDNIFNKIASKFKINKAKPFDEGSDDEARNKKIQEAADKEKGSAKADDIPDCKKDEKNCNQKERDAEVKAAKDGKNQIDGYTEQSGKGPSNSADAILSENADVIAKKSADTAAKEMLGVAGSILKITGPFDNACMVYGWVRTLSFVAKTVRVAQMIGYADMFLKTGHMIKAMKDSNISPQDAEYMGNILTKTVKKSDGSVTKAATDSFGYRSVAFGDTGMDEAASLAVGGASFGGFIQEAVDKLISFLGGRQTATATCGFLNNPLVQAGSAAIGVALIFVPGGQAAKGAQFNIQSALSPLVMIAGMFLPAMIGDILAGRLVDENTFGEKSGNLITSGTAGMLSQVGSYGGNSIMKKEKAKAYIDYNAQVAAKYAEFDRQTKSPFDATSPNTFLGALYTRFMPFAVRSQSSMGAVSSIFSIVGATTSNLFSQKTYASTIQPSNECKDPDIVYYGIASDAFCNPIVGIPTEYLNLDPIEIVDKLKQADLLDKDTEQPKGKYTEYISNCIQREAPFGTDPEGQGDDKTADCFIDNEQKAMMYVHAIDSRIMDVRDNGLPSPNAGSSSGSEAASSPGDNTTCSANTIDMGQYDNAHDNGKKTSIHLCAVPNLPGRGYAAVTTYQSIKAVDPSKQAEATGKAIVNARASGATFDMVEAAKKEGVNLTLGGNFAFRSFEHQVQLRQEWCASGDCDGAAVPGTSNHEMGLAIDFGLPGKPHSAIRTSSKELQWLRANAEKFGFKDTAMPKEDWHWQYVK